MIGLVETWMNNNAKHENNLVGYKEFYLDAVQLGKRGRSSGGIEFLLGMVRQINSSRFIPSSNMLLHF